MGGPGSGRKKGTGSSNKKPESFGINMSKMKANPMSKSLKASFKKAGGVNSKAYKTWVKKNWT